MREHANRSYRDVGLRTDVVPPGTHPGWRPACKCGWQGAYVVATRDAARTLYHQHQAWAQRALQGRLRRQRARVGQRVAQ